MDGASLCIYTVSSINNPRCAWHGGVPESPFVITDCWRLHKLLPPAESALCQAPRAFPGPQLSRRDTRRGALASGLCPCPATTGTPQTPWLLEGFCSLQSLCRLQGAATAGKLFIGFGLGSFAFYRRLCGFFPPLIFLKKNPLVRCPAEAKMVERSGCAKQGSQLGQAM